MSVWINRLLLLADRHRRERDSLVLQERIRTLEREKEETGVVAVRERNMLIEAEKARADANNKLASVIDRVVPRVGPIFEEVIGVLKVSDRVYEVYHFQERSRSRILGGRQYIEEWSVPNGTKAAGEVRRHRISSKPRFPDTGFNMNFKTAWLSEDFSEEDLLELVEEVANQERRQFE